MSTKVILIRNAAVTDFGGGERIPVLIAKELQTLDFQPIVFSGSKKLLAFAMSENVPHKKTWWWGRQNWNGVRALLFPIYVAWQVLLYFYYLRQFISIRPSIIHVQSKDDFIAATLAGRTLGIGVFWSDYADLKHIWVNYSVWYKNPVGKLVYLAAKGANHIVVVSKEDRRLIGIHIPDGKIKDKLIVIYNGTFDVYIAPKKNKDLIFISTARLVTDKGIGELIAAFTKLHSKHSDTALHLVGDGPEQERFIHQAKGVDGITFFGHQSKPLEYVSKADIFVLPTYHEGFSIALLEASMQGLAIITTNVGGNTEIITDKETGILIPAQNVDALYDAMVLLYKNVELRRKVGKAARKNYVDHFNFEQIIRNKFLPLYNGQ